MIARLYYQYKEEEMTMEDRQRLADDIISMIMNRMVDEEVPEQREVVVEALHDAITFFATPEFGTEIS